MAQNREVGKQYNIKVFGSNNSKETKQDNQNRLKMYVLKRVVVVIICK